MKSKNQQAGMPAVAVETSMMTLQWNMDVNVIVTNETIMKLKLRKDVHAVLKKVAPVKYKQMLNTSSLKDFAPLILYYDTCLVGEMRNYNPNYKHVVGKPMCRSCAVISECLHELANKGYKESFEYYLTALATHARFHHRKLPKIENGYGKRKWF